MGTITVRTPAKINLTLEVLDKRDDGFHNIQSIMQSINLYDYLTISISENESNEICLSGNNNEIPYNEQNLVHKAATEFLSATSITNKKLTIYLEKNIPVSAGLAGGSSNAVGCFLALNQLFQNPLTEIELNTLCAKLGSDLNFCLKGGCALCTSRGENIEPIGFCEFNVSLIKPKKLGVSAKEAYTKFAKLENRSNPNNTGKMLTTMQSTKKIDPQLIYNSLEIAIINDYQELQCIKQNEPNSLMSGSGTTFFTLKNKPDYAFNSVDFWIKTGLKAIPTGVEVVEIIP